MGIVNDERGQMTVELAVMLPIIIIIAVIATNAVLFFSDCAAFDRVSREAVRVYAASPAYGQAQSQSVALVRESIEAVLDQPYLETEVSAEAQTGGCVRYSMTLEFSPTLFGMGLRSEVLGVSLPKLSHTATYVVDTYKSGVIV